MSTTHDHGALGLTVYAASAGTGKTHRLASEIQQALDPEGPTPITPESVMAVTFTRKAAAELASRIRTNLIRSGAHAQAQMLPLARIGTVHAVCLRLLQDHALAGGLSPRVDVLPGEEYVMLREALDHGLDGALRERLDALAFALEIRWDARRARSHWLLDVQDIMSLARTNRIRPEHLARMAERSADELLTLMGPPAADGAALDRDLADALAVAADLLERLHDGSQKTQTALALVQLVRSRQPEIPWSDWVRLQKLAPHKSVDHTVQPLREVAARADQHPRLQQQLRQLIADLFRAAEQGLQTYGDWKRKRRVVDFIDMVDIALDLVELDELRDDLRATLALVAVDELQDTSPIQLALFVRLHQIAGRSVWVGDRKQCIFEFAGADPELMTSVASWIAASGGTNETLAKNRRSRRELVEACSQLFGAALSRHGDHPEEVHVRPHRTPSPELADLPPFGLWSLEATSRTEEAGALAEGVRRLLAAPHATPVCDPKSNTARPLGPSDVAILVATNDEALRVARALAKLGISATVARDGLLTTPEGTLLRAALSLLLDAHDSVSRATIEALTGFDGTSPDAWLERLIRAADAGDGSPPPVGHLVARLAADRPELARLSPSELVDRVLTTLDVTRLCSRWPDPDQRIGNIDALRALVRRYEERCGAVHEAATIGGLLRYFNDAAQKTFRRDEERASDEQHVGSGDAVVVTTYHRAKGLEWNVVVLASLDRPPRRTAFEVSPETDQSTFDPRAPLAGRWIRCWPWPYGPQRRSPLADAAAVSPAGRAVKAREASERARLLYVGFTRARDHLILAARIRPAGPAVRWLDELCDDAGIPCLRLPDAHISDDTRVTLRDPSGRARDFAARHWQLGSSTSQEAPEDSTIRLWPAPATPPTHSIPFRIAPSQDASDWPDLPETTVGAIESLGERLSLRSHRDTDWTVVGQAIHAFLASDTLDLHTADRHTSERTARAERLLQAASATGLIAPESLLHASDRLRAWVERNWPGARWLRELPIHAEIETPDGTRRIEGIIDLLLTTPQGAVLIDHKTYPGPRNTWRTRALEHAPQIQAYAHALTAAGIPLLAKWIHFPISAGAVQFL